MATLSSQITVGIVGGSDLPKQKEQLSSDVLSLYPYNFSQNGLVAYKDGTLLGSTTINTFLGEEALQRIVNWTLSYLSKVTLPVKRGTFIEYRTGMLNISPIGRNCTRPERDAFEAYDASHNVRPEMVKAMQVEFSDLDLTFSIGGQISFDVFPKGWDKTYCLRYLPAADFDAVHFFGDKTAVGGNDYEIYQHERTEGHKVTCPEETRRICEELFF